MPRTATGPHLWLRPERRDRRGQVTHQASWVIIDGKHQQGTGCLRGDRRGAERELERYIGRKHRTAAKAGVRDPAQIPVVDVLTLYAANIVPQHARPRETLARIERLVSFFGDNAIADINGELCRSFVRSRSTPGAGRDDLSVLRAAINHHREEGHCREIVSVALPDKNRGRQRWLTRAEAAELIWGAWRFRETQKGRATARASRQHVARFILVALYTGTRAGAVCSAALEPTEGRGFIDLERGIFYRRPAGVADTKKRRPPVPLPRRLLAHLRRWKRHGQAFAVEWNGAAVKDVDKAFRHVAHDAGMPDVTPHVLRHTAATWLMQLGTDLWEAAGYLGMSVDQLERNYGHHHPDHLKGARDAFDRPPKHRQSNAAAERGLTASNVRKIADNR